MGSSHKYLESNSCSPFDLPLVVEQVTNLVGAIVLFWLVLFKLKSKADKQDTK
jgi:hypothetical protein